MALKEFKGWEEGITFWQVPHFKSYIVFAKEKKGRYNDYHQVCDIKKDDDGNWKMFRLGNGVVINRKWQAIIHKKIKELQKCSDKRKVE